MTISWLVETRLSKVILTPIYWRTWQHQGCQTERSKGKGVQICESSEAVRGHGQRRGRRLHTSSWCGKPHRAPVMRRWQWFFTQGKNTYLYVFLSFLQSHFGWRWRATLGRTSLNWMGLWNRLQWGRAVTRGRSRQPSGLIHSMLLNTKMQVLSK